MLFRSSEIDQNRIGDNSTTTTIVNQFDLTGLVVRAETDIDAIASKLYQKQQVAQRGRGMRTVPMGR